MTLTYTTLQTAITTNVVNILIILVSANVLIPKWVKQLTLTSCIIIVVSKLDFVIPGLQNTLSTIHPILILIIYSININIFFLKTFINFYHKFNTQLLLMFISLFLGGWWALQEFTWGGWWNWDGVETPIFLLVSYLTYAIFHSKVSFLSLLFFNKLTKLSFYLTIITILFIRYGNLNSVHSFIVLSSIYNQYITVFLLNAYLYTLLFLIKTFSFWSLSFLKTAILLILLLFFKKIIWNLCRLKYKYIMHIILFIIVIILLNFNIYYLEISFYKQDNNLILFSTSDNFWIKSSCNSYLHNILHLKVLIN